MSATRSRGWCFTINNWTDDDIVHLMSLFEEDDNCSYLMVGFEIAPRTNTPHIQGYIYYTNAVSTRTMRKRLVIAGRQHHIEAQKSKSNVAAYYYCAESSDDYYEAGQRPLQGHRTDLAMISRDIERGRPLTQIAHDYPNQYFYHYRGFIAYKDLLFQEQRVPCKLIWYDPEKFISEIDRIETLYAGSRYHVITEYDSKAGVQTALLSRKYQYIFVPNSLDYLFEKELDMFSGTLDQDLEFRKE